VTTASGDGWTIGDRRVNRIGFGTKRLADRASAVALLRRAVELGVDHIDTAAFYPTRDAPERGRNGFTSLGWANHVLREALAPYDSLVIATKVGPTASGMARPDQLRGLVEENLHALGREQLDLVYLRQQGLDTIAHHFEALAKLRAEGIIRHLGVSNVRAEHLAEARRIAPVVAVQNRYGVGFGRVNDELLDGCGEAGIAFVPFFAVAGAGREAGGVASDAAVERVARAHDATAAQVRIAWTVSRGPHVLAIPGTSDPAHLAENVAAGELTLSPDDLAALNETTE
jgi:aryl-alcohol dehydrogenase-like predicted oxidoreductase